MGFDVIVGILIGAAVSVAFLLIYQKYRGDSAVSEKLEKQLNELFPKLLQSANESLITMAREKLGAEKQDIKTDLENKRKAIEKLVETVQKDLRETDRTSQSILQQIKDHEKITSELKITADGLRKVLTNNQLRGQFGEQVAEDLLNMVGFVKGVDFEHNKSQSTTTSRPDFCIYLPDKTKINVDVKFPYANLQKSAETDDRAAKKSLMKLFESDVRQKINQITSRDYINVEDKTVDFVILFVPNEMIFSYIYDKMNEVWVEAMKKKVVLAGPFSFTAILRLIRQAYDNFSYQKNIHQIINQIKKFEIEFTKYNEEFTKIGTYINRLSDQYQTVDSTRTRQLLRVVDKIKIEEKETEKMKLLE